MINKMQVNAFNSIMSGRGKDAGQLGTLAASHCPVNGPCLPEGGNFHDNF